MLIYPRGIYHRFKIMPASKSTSKKNTKAVEKRIEQVIRQADLWQKELLVIVDHDAEAYLRFSKIPKTDVKRKRLAQKEISRIPKDICRICYQAVGITPILVKKGSKYLLSDLEIALEFLWAAYRSAFILTKQQ